ncbi:MAG: hypothetical protein JNM36_01635 [Chitinophagales bacterium]|nr:hypothetical protein [Chitinophagales bacterium]
MLLLQAMMGLGMLLFPLYILVLLVATPLLTAKVYEAGAKYVDWNIVVAFVWFIISIIVAFSIALCLLLAITMAFSLLLDSTLN